MTATHTAILLAGLCPSLAAQGSPSLLHDVNQTGFANPASDPEQFTVFKGDIYFQATTLDQGAELWRTTSADRDTSLFFDFLPGTGSGQPEQLTVDGNRMFLVASNPVAGEELFVTDGTLDGTRLVADIRPGAQGARPQIVGTLNGILYFAADDGTHGRELWRSDGTTAGTSMVRDIDPGSGGGIWRSPVREAFALAGGRLIFRADDGVNGAELWTSDGTTAGTTLVTDILPGSNGSSPGYFETLDHRVVFAAYDAQYGTEPWVTDGSAAGTMLLVDLVPGRFGTIPGEFRFKRFGGHIYFGPSALFRTDGTPAGTSPFLPNSPSAPIPLAVVGRQMFFSADRSITGRELWVTDGTVAGSRMVRDIQPGPGDGVLGTDAIAGDGILLFLADNGVHGRELWRSDGQLANTRMVLDLAPGAPSPGIEHLFHDGRGEILFSWDDGTIGAEPWSLDPRMPRVDLLFDVNRYPPGATMSSEPYLVHDHHGTVFFGADDGVHGTELWKSDGTVTAMVADLSPGSGGSDAAPLHSFGERLLFSARPGGFGTHLEMWVTDGTPAGTLPLISSQLALQLPWPPNYVELGGRVLFVAGTATAGMELWHSDGTASGTAMLVELAPGRASRSPGSLIRLGNHVVFIAEDDYGRDMLWRTDGTAAGTQLLNVPSLSLVYVAARFRDRIFLLARDNGYDKELWTSDGTAAGTQLFLDIRQGGSSSPGRFKVVRDQLFFVANDGTHGSELWVTDGSVSGTRMAADIWPGSLSSSPNDLIPFGDRLLFRADTPSVYGALWITDGSAQSTRPLTTVQSRLGQPDQLLVSADDRAWFMADDGVRGQEIWTTDGTPEGTRIAVDLLPGAGSSDPADLAISRGRLLFTADDGIVGREVWHLNPGASTQENGAPCGATLPALWCTSPRLGGVLTVAGGAWSGPGNVVVFAGTPASRPGQLPGGCRLYLDAGSAARLAAVPLPNGGTWSVAFALPAAPALQGLRIALQAGVAYTGATGVDVTASQIVTLGF